MTLPEKVICLKCSSSGQLSKVWFDGTMSTLIGGNFGFWDELGVRHFHDANSHRHGFHCSKGHRWEVKEVPPCPDPSCDFDGDSKTTFFEPR